jgi:hypothetical protein
MTQPLNLSSIISPAKSGPAAKLWPSHNFEKFGPAKIWLLAQFWAYP